MAQDYKKISELEEKTTLADQDLIAIVDSAVTPIETKKITLANARSVLVGPAGPVGTQYPWKDQWLSATVYAVNDCVQQNGNGYVCVASHTSNNFITDFGAGKWSLFSNGNQYPWKGQWTTTTNYYPNDCIYQSGNGYVCLVAHTSGVFATDLAANDWSLLVQRGEQGEQGIQGLTGTAITLLYDSITTPPVSADDGTLFVTFIP